MLDWTWFGIIAEETAPWGCPTGPCDRPVGPVRSEPEAHTDSLRREESSVGKVMGAVTLTIIGLVVGLAVLAAAAGAGGGTPTSPEPAPGGRAAGPGPGGIDPGAALPAGWAALEQAAAATCPGLSWSVLAAIGTVESDSGRSTAPGVSSGANAAGAEGPFKFEPSTFAAHATIGPGGADPPTPYDPVDAAYTAAALLCADGAGAAGGATGLRGSVLDYNHSPAYADTVLVLSLAFADVPTVTGSAVAAIQFAAEQLGTPYLWGGTGQGGFDCSGLVQAAYQQAGIDLPRVAQDQFDAEPPVPDGSGVQPGDLLFFGSGTAAVDHVGLYVGAGEMVDAPHTGAAVRLDSADWPDLVGATRPA